MAAPTVFTPAYLARSVDTFPLEFIEIQQQHVTVLGEDHFAPLVFEPAHVRLQCERELKVLEIGLQQGILVSQGRSESLKWLGDDVAERLLRACAARCGSRARARRCRRRRSSKWPSVPSANRSLA